MLENGSSMRRGLLPGALSIVAVYLATACVAPPRAGVPMPVSAEVLPADARALRYGATAPDVFDNPQLRDRLRALFGADLTSGAGREYGAPAYFPAAASIRMVRISDRDYIAITGCVTNACQGHRGLLLIGPDEQLLARLDQGGFSRYYEYGPDATGGVQARTTLDGAWLAVQGVGRG
jgi:hypothetical protein